MKRIIITAALLGGVLFQSNAQEFTIGINAAQAGTSYKLPNGKVQLKPSFGGEIGWQVPLSNHIKVLTGVEFFRYQSTATLSNNQVYKHNQIDDVGSAFEYRVVTNGYSEAQTVSALRIPLMLQLTTGSLEKTQWYFNAGGKFMLPGKINVKAGASKLTTTGYYPDVNAEVHSLPQHGFGEVNNWQSAGEYSTKSGWLLSAGTGLSFRLSPKGGTRLYAGAYADYGISNLQANKTPASLITYDPKNVANVKANGTLGMDGVKKMNFVNVGVQLKIGFGHKQKSKKSAATKIAEELKRVEKADVKETPSVDTVKKSTITDDEKALLGKPVYFGKRDNIDLNPESRQLLDKVAGILSKYPESRITIKGHACDLGTPTINEKRSRERAAICADYLISQGVAKERIQIAAISSAEPVAPNDSEKNRQKNRRVTFGLNK